MKSIFLEIFTSCIVKELAVIELLQMWIYDVVLVHQSMIFLLETIVQLGLF